jgi:ribosomal protein S24E
MEKLTILNQKENPVFNRKEVELSIEAGITPKIKEAENLVSEKFSVNQESVNIKKIKGKFGSNNFIISAYVYPTKEDREKAEPKFKKEITVEEKKENA